MVPDFSRGRLLKYCNCYYEDLFAQLRFGLSTYRIIGQLWGGEGCITYVEMLAHTYPELFAALEHSST